MALRSLKASRLIRHRRPFQRISSGRRIGVRSMRDSRDINHVADSPPDRIVTVYRDERTGVMVRKSQRHPDAPRTRYVPHLTFTEPVDVVELIHRGQRYPE